MRKKSIIIVMHRFLDRIQVKRLEFPSISSPFKLAINLTNQIASIIKGDDSVLMLLIAADDQEIIGQKNINRTNFRILNTYSSFCVVKSTITYRCRQIYIAHLIKSCIVQVQLYLSSYLQTLTKSSFFFFCLSTTQ